MACAAGKNDLRAKAKWFAQLAKWFALHFENYGRPWENDLRVDLRLVCALICAIRAGVPVAQRKSLFTLIPITRRPQRVDLARWVPRQPILAHPSVTVRKTGKSRNKRALPKSPATAPSGKIIKVRATALTIKSSKEVPAT
jgi:hypothetical protein